MTIERGTLLLVRTAFGDTISVRATGASAPGHDFAVVWVCTEDEYDAAEAQGREPEGIPWPRDAVENAEVATAP